MYFPQLHNHTMYSFLDGLYTPKEWIQFCIDKEIKAFAMTDHGNVHGILEFYLEAQKQIKKGADFVPILGSEFYFVPELQEKEKRYHLIVLAKNFQGYQNLLKLSTLSYNQQHFYKRPRICFQDLKENSEGLIITTACIASLFHQLILDKKIPRAKEWLQNFYELFNDDFYIEFQFLNLDKKWNKETKQFDNTENIQYISNQILYNLAQELNIKCILTNDNHYIYQSDKQLQDIMIANSYAGKNGWKFAHDHYYIKSIDEIKQMRDTYHPSFTDEDLDLMITNCYEIVDKCKELVISTDEFNLPTFQYSLHPLGDDNDTAKSLIFKIITNNKHLIPQGQEEIYAQRLKIEVELINKYNLLDYFLIIEDILSYCRNNNIPYGPGRGSVGGSLLAYLLNITKIDPIKERCIWERFLTDERLAGGHPPDIDLDISDEERDLVRDYIYDKYGKEYVSPICTFGTLKIKSAIRDIARIESPNVVFDFDVKLTDEEIQQDIMNKANDLPTIENKKKSQREIDYICSKFHLTPPEFTEIEYFWKVVEHDEELQQWLEQNQSIKNKLVKILGNVRQVGIHASALAICKDKMTHRIPLLTHAYRTKATRTTVTQYNGIYTELAGAVKVDTLGLRTLSIIKNALILINKRYNQNLHWSTLPINDSVAFFMLQKGWTDTAFQYGSIAFSRLLKSIGDVLEKRGQIVKDNELGRLIIALNRPGPIQQQMDKQMIQNIEKPEQIEYLHPLLQPILRTTYGIIIYQETVMEICRIIGGFTLGEAEDARRAIAKKKVDKLKKYKAKFVKYATTILSPVMNKEDAKKLWEQIYSFSNYGFNKSHSCGYDMLGMHTLYLIAHYPLEWFTAVLNKSSSDKIYEVYHYLTNPKFMARYNLIRQKFNLLSIPNQIKFSLPDVNLSTHEFNIVDNTIVMPLNVIKNVGDKAVENIVKGQPYLGLNDFIQRSDCNIRVIAHLILAGAFVHIEPHKTVQQLLQQAYEIKNLSLPFEYSNLDRFKELELKNDILSFISNDYITLFRDLFHPHIQDLDVSRHNIGMNIMIGGKIAKMRKIKTKKGDDMSFITLINKNKMLDVTIFPKQYVQYKKMLKIGKIVEISGTVNYYRTKNVVLQAIKVLYE